MSTTLHREHHPRVESIGGEEAVTILADVERFVRPLPALTPPCDIQRRALSCYEDYALLRISSRDGSHHELVGLYAPGDFWPLDATAIDSVNKRAPLRLTLDTVNDYVDLYHGWSAGPEVRPVAKQPGGAFSIRFAGHDVLIGPTGRISPPVRMRPHLRVRAVHGVKKWIAIDPQSDEMRRLLRDLGWDVTRADEPVHFLARKADVSFYHAHTIYELLAWRDPVPHLQQYYVVHDPQGIVRPLDGSSLPIHATNSAEPPQFNSDADVVEYLRFFCWATRADDGRFLLVERFRDIPWQEAPAEEVRDRILPALKVPAVARAGEHWECSAIVSYGRHLFSASFRISPKGNVEMIDDELLLEDSLPTGEYEPSKLTIDGTLTSEDSPATYLDDHLDPPGAPPAGLVDYSPDQVLAMLGGPHGDAG